MYKKFLVLFLCYFSLCSLFGISRASVMWTSERACVSEERGGEEEGDSVCVIFLVSSIICFLCIVSLY